MSYGGSSLNVAALLCVGTITKSEKLFPPDLTITPGLQTKANQQARSIVDINERLEGLSRYPATKLSESRRCHV